MVKDEKNQVARAVFITSSGFLGFILGRRGLIKRTTFGVVGALAAASYCNPEQAKDIADVGLKLAKTKFDEVSSQYDCKWNHRSVSINYLMPPFNISQYLNTPAC